LPADLPDRNEMKAGASAQAGNIKPMQSKPVKELTPQQRIEQVTKSQPTFSFFFPSGLYSVFETTTLSSSTVNLPHESWSSWALLSK
jgi:hypothetical protein